MQRNHATDNDAFRQWRKVSLAGQFALAGGVVMALATLLVGFWVSARIEESVVRNSANATALYMESFIAPLSQDLARQPRMSDEARQEFEQLFRNTPLGERVISYKIWAEGGRIAESSDPALVDRVFEPDDELRSAWRGAVGAEFEELAGAESAGERALDLPLLEIYSPIRENLSGRVIAVAEFYEVNEQLARDLAEARLNSWLAVAAVMLGIGAMLFVIVHRGSRTIDRARASLNARMEQLSAMSETNRNLRLRVQEAAARASEMNERAMRRLGADLHDGPAQHLGFAALKLDALRDAATAANGDRKEVDAVSGAVQDALHEIRAISKGLAAPEIEGLSAKEIVDVALQSHAARTGARPSTEIAIDANISMSPAAKICLYRFIQEGLNNAAKHAEGRGASVAIATEGGMLSVTVRDRGPGFREDTPSSSGGLGLSGLRDRVESLGGSFERRNRSDGGAEVSMTLDLEAA